MTTRLSVTGGGAVTVRAAEPEKEFNWAEMVVAPDPTAEARPVLLTVAAERLLEAQIAEPETSWVVLSV